MKIQELKQNLERTIGYAFKNDELLVQAFTRKGYAVQNPDYRNNEVLEKMGDKILGMVLMYELIERYKVKDHNTGELVVRIDEHDMSRIEMHLVCRDYLAKRVDEFGWNQYCLASETEFWDTKKAKADLLEAIVAAIAYDCNLNIAIIKEVTIKILDLNKALRNEEREIDDWADILDDSVVDNAMDRLAELYQKGYIDAPEYKAEEVVGKRGDQIWEVKCFINDRSFYGRHEQLERAKKKAAFKWLEEFYRKGIEE